MAENKTDQTPEFTSSIHGENSDSGEDPTISTTTSSEDKLRKKDPETDPEPKRRKNCPSALDKFEAIKSSSNSSFSFTFDTKVGGAPEFTPKFGSFNLAATAASADNDRCCQIPAIKAKGVELEEAEVIVEREVVEVLSSVDGIKSVE